jgi:adenylate kinase family enzyme
MAHLLYKWINEDVVLSRKVTNFARDFSNGFLFADLLHVYNQIGNVDEYINKSASSAKITNFCRLEPVFRTLGVKFDSKIAFEIIKEYPRTALNMVSRLKSVLDKISSSASAVIGRPREDGVRRLSNMPLRLTRPTYDKAQHELFAKSIRMYIKAQNEVDMAKHLKPFTDFQEQLEKNAYEQGVADLKAFFAEKDMIRQQRRQNLQREHEFLHDWQEKGIEEWAYNQQIQKEREDHARRMKQRAENAKATSEDNARLSSMAEAKSGLEMFEGTLLHAEVMKAKTSVQADGLTASMQKKKTQLLDYNVTSRMNMDDFFKATKRVAGNPKQWKLEYEKAISTVRDTSGRTRALREQRERRRRKFLADSQRTRASQASKSEKMMICKKLIGKTLAEKDLLEDLEKISFHTKIFKKNREDREEAYRIRREQDEEEAVLRDNEYFMVQRSAYEEEILQQQERIAKYDAARSLSMRRATITFCNDTIKRTVELALRMVERRRLREDKVELGVSQELQTIFVLNGTDMERDGANTNLTPDEKIWERELAQYLPGEGFWADTRGAVADFPSTNEHTEEDHSPNPDEDEQSVTPNTESLTEIIPVAIPSSELTGCCVQVLSDCIKDSAPKVKLELPPRMPMTVCIVGRPFSGKSEQARRLAEKYNLAVIDVNTLLGEALEWAGAKGSEVLSLEGTLENVDDREYHDRVSRIGAEAQSLLMEGKTLPDNVFIDLVLAKIRLVAAQAASSSKTAIESDIGVDRDDFKDELGYRSAILRVLFDTWDADCSETLDIVELVSAVRSFGEGLSDEHTIEEAMELVNQMDEDHDGVITFAETQRYFINLLSHHTNEIFDATMKTIIAAARQKPYRGWVLDGFPNNVNQAKALERALTGYNDDGQEGTEAFSNRFSFAMASQPARPATDPCALYGKSGIDLVLNIDISPEIICRRALGRRKDPLNPLKKYHLQFNPPSSEEPIKMRLVDTDDMIEWRAKLAPVLSAYENNLPSLETWFIKFDILRTVKPFLPNGGSALGTDALCELLSIPIQLFVDEERKKNDNEKVALTRTLRRKAAGRVFSSLSEKYPLMTTADFRNILISMKEEFRERFDATLEAQLKNDDATVSKVVHAYNDQPRLPPRSFGNMVKIFNENIEKSKVLSNAVRQKGDETNFINAIMSVAGENGILASSFSHLLSAFSRKASEFFESREFSLSTIYHLYADGPIDLDHVNVTIDTVKVKKLLQAYNAKVNLLLETESSNAEGETIEESSKEATKKVVPVLFDLGEEDMAEEPSKGKKGKSKTPEASEVADPVDQNAFVSQVMELMNQAREEPIENDGFVSMVSTLRDCVKEKLVEVAESAEPPPEPEDPPPPKYEALPIVNFSSKIEVEKATLLMESWDKLVRNYTNVMVKSYNFLSLQRSNVLEYIVETRENFHAYLSRLDSKNKILTDLQKDINSIPDDLRYDDEVKSELHERVRVTISKMQAMMEEKNDTASALLQELRTNNYLENSVEQYVEETTVMMQAEIERFCHCRKFLIDNAMLKQGLLLRIDTEEMSIPALTSAFGEEVAEAESPDPKVAKGKGAQVDEEDAAVFAPYKPLDSALSVATAYVETVRVTEVERLKQVKTKHEEAYVAKLASYDESVGKGGKGKSPATPLPDFDEPSVDDDLKRALAYEEEQFLMRLRRLDKIARREGDAIFSYGSSVYDKLQAMTKYRMDEEYRACYAFEKMARETIESEIPFEFCATLRNTTDSVVKRLVDDEERKNMHGPQQIPHFMYTTGPKGHELVIDHCLRYFPEEESPTEPSVEAFAPDKFSTSQELLLEKQCKLLQESAGGCVTKGAVVRMLQGAAACGALPSKWGNTTVHQLSELVESFEDQMTFTVRLDEMLDNLLYRSSRPSSVDPSVLINSEVPAKLATIN